MTLIELLVVIVILTTIVGAAIPIMSPANDDRRLREASRGLNTFITGAQTRAIANRRPYGIMLKRLSQDTEREDDRGVCLEVFYAEQPPAYAGFDANSRACVGLHPDNPSLVLIRFLTRGNTLRTSDRLPEGWDADLFPTGMIRPGDVVELAGTRYELLPEEQGPGNYAEIKIKNIGSVDYFERDRDDTPAIILARPLNDSGQALNVRYNDDGFEIGQVVAQQRPYWASPVPYKIFRQPTVTFDQPYQLPEGAAIDLRASGLGEQLFFNIPEPNEPFNDEPVVVMFSPEGKVSRLRYNLAYQTGTSPNAIAQYDQPVSENLFLLVGKRENIPAPPVGTDPTLDQAEYTTRATSDQLRAKLREPINWLRGESRWVVIGSLSGRIVTVENAFVDPASPITLSNQSVAPSTEEMRRMQILAAREFTRDMRQLGGR